MTERTLVLIKPDGVQRQLVGEIISRIERKGLAIAALELRNVTEELASQHYAEHEGKPFFGSLLEFITSAPVVAAIVEGPRAIAAFRQLAGGTDPVEKATPGTIRGDFGLETQFNLVHGSDSHSGFPAPSSATRGLRAGFGPGCSGEGDSLRWYGILTSGERRCTSVGHPDEDFDKRDDRVPVMRRGVSSRHSVRRRVGSFGAARSETITSPGEVTRAHSEALAWPRRLDAPGGLRRIRGRRCPIFRPGKRADTA